METNRRQESLVRVGRGGLCYGRAQQEDEVRGE